MITSNAATSALDTGDIRRVTREPALLSVRKPMRLLRHAAQSSIPSTGYSDSQEATCHSRASASTLYQTTFGPHLATRDLLTPHLVPHVSRNFHQAEAKSIANCRNDTMANMDQVGDAPYMPNTAGKCMVAAYNFELAFRMRGIPQLRSEKWGNSAARAGWRYKSDIVRVSIGARYRNHRRN